jgi:hypothetical protein
MGEVAIESLAAQEGVYSLLFRHVKHFIRFYFACSCVQSPALEPKFAFSNAFFAPPI